MRKGRCIKCGELTPYALRYDIDGSPIWVHKKCEEDVKFAFIVLFGGNEELAKEITKDWHSPIN